MTKQKQAESKEHKQPKNQHKPEYTKPRITKHGKVAASMLMSTSYTGTT